MKVLYTICTVALLTSCNSLTPTPSQAILNIGSTDENNLKILSLNGKSQSLFFSKSQYLIEAGETKFSIRCFFRNRKSFAKFNIQTKPKKVYNIQAECNQDTTIYTIFVEGRTVATQKVKTKFFNDNTIGIEF